MRSQHPGISRPHPSQQQGADDMQLWQQHLMSKQLQEIQRQRQLQQLELGRRQHSSLSQLSDVARQAGIENSPPVLSGMPINNASNYMWSSEHMGGEPKTTNSSLMFLAGNMNWAGHSGPPTHGISNGLMFSHDQGQTIRPMGFVQQHGDQSLYGTPVSSTRYSSNHYPQTQGSRDCTDVMNNKAGGSHSEKGSMHPSMINYFQNVVPEHGCVQEGVSVANQGFQGKSLFSNAPAQDYNSDAMLGNFQQVNHLSRSVQAQEFQGVQERHNWSGKLQENKMAQVGSSRGVANLDPTEEKLLFGTNNGGNWDGSFEDSTTTETGSYNIVNPVQNNDHFSAFPSIQSGSWSALMLDALDASSSDTGLQEEWSGLSFQKTEPSTRNHSALLNDNGKQQMSWDENNLKNVSSLTSRPLPLFNDAGASPNHHIYPSFQQSYTKMANEQNETVLADVSRESAHQASKEANNKQLDQGHRRKQFIGSSLQEQTSFDNVSNGNWEGQMHEQSVSTISAADTEFNMKKMQMVWNHQQKIPMSNLSNLSRDKSNVWNISQPPGGHNTSDIPDNDGTDKHAQRKDTKKTMHMKRDHDGNFFKVGGNHVSTSFPNPAGRQGSVKSDIGSPKMRSEYSDLGNFAAPIDSSALKLNQEVKQQVSHQSQLDYGKHVSIGSSQKYKEAENVTRYQNQLSRSQQVRDSSMYNIEKNEADQSSNHTRESSNPRDVPNESYFSNHSHPSQHTNSEGGSRENSLLSGNNSDPLVSSSPKSSGQSGRKTAGPRRFQYHPMGNLEMNLELAGSHVNTLYSLGPNHSVARGSNNQEQGHSGRSECTSQVVPPRSMDLGKEQLTWLQRNAKAADEAQPSVALPNHDSGLSSFDGSVTHISQNKRIGQASHNMLELLNKVDQSRNNSTATHFSLSDHNAPSELAKRASDGSTCLQHDQSPVMQGFGLKLAPPSQWQPVLDRDLSSQASIQNANDVGSRNLDSGGGDKDRAWSSSISSVPSIPRGSQLTKDENFDNRSNLYGQMNKQTSYSDIQGNTLAFTAATLPYARDQSAVQQQQQHVSSVTRSSQVDQSANLSIGSQVNIDAHVKPCSHPRQEQGSNNGNVSDQLSRGSMPSVASRIPPPRLNPSGDTCAPAALQFHSLISGPSQPTNSSSLLRSSGQQLPTRETTSAAQPSTAPGMSQHGGFSSMLHKVWSGLSAQQRLSIIQAQKVIPKLPHSTGPLPNSMDTNSWTPQRADDQSNKGGSAPTQFGTCSTNSQQSICAEEYLVKDQSLQYMPHEKVDGAPKTDYALRGQERVSISSPVHLHHQELNRGKHAHDSSLDSQKEHVSVPNADAQKQNYSLLQQVQAMKGSDSDPSNRAGKRLKADFGAVAPQMEWAAGQRFIYGQNTVFKDLDAASQHGSFPSDVKMLSFSRDNEDESVNVSSQLITREKTSEDFLNSRQNNLQNHTHSLSNLSALTLMRGNERPPPSNSQMASSWFELYRSSKNGQLIATSDGPGNSQNSTKANTQNFAFTEVSERMDNSNAIVQRDDATQVGFPQSKLSTALVANENPSSHSLPSSAIDNNAVLIPKKRKTATSELLPWHKEVTEASQRPLSISIAEQDWAKAANRLIEKVEDELERIEDGSSMKQARRRLILTTQLMQQILPSIPAKILREDATVSYDSVTYFVAKSALGDASSLISSSGSDSIFHSNCENMISEKLNSSGKVRDCFLFKKMEGFIGRARKLESDLLRLERKASILDVRVECHDLERCSIINRFAKFHGRAHIESIEGSSTSEMPPFRTFPQRHVTPHAVTSNLPDSVRCLSL